MTICLQGTVISESARNLKFWIPAIIAITDNSVIKFSYSFHRHSIYPLWLSEDPLGGKKAKNPPRCATWNKSLVILFFYSSKKFVWLRLPVHLLSLGVCQRFLYLFFSFHHILQVVMLIWCLFMSKL